MAYFIGTIGVVIVAASVGILAARHPEAGAYFVYIGRTFGPFAGAMAGWAMVSAYLFTAVAVTLSFAIFLGNFLSVFDIQLKYAGVDRGDAGVHRDSDLFGLSRREVLLTGGIGARSHFDCHHCGDHRAGRQVPRVPSSIPHSWTLLPSSTAQCSRRCRS